MRSLSDYRAVVGPQVVDELEALAKRFKGKRMLHINSTAVGGGVAEILNRMVPLLNELGIEAHWEVVKGGEAFYAVTKKIHNALHGGIDQLSSRDRQIFEETTLQNLKEIKLDADIVFIHDPQPIGLIDRKKELKNKWVWRCHVDVSAPNAETWGFLKPYIERYDRAIFSAPSFEQKLAIPQSIISPSIDPLSDKNRPMGDAEIESILRRLEIPTDKPLITQVSRFDRLKDPLGVIKAFRQIQKSVKARLLLVGGTATDDPEGPEVLLEVKKAVGSDEDILIRLLPPTNHIEINAIQRASTIIVQKSLKEGFGLTITEALWKEKPVIAGAVGGIPLQIKHEHSGILINSIDETSHWMRRLLEEPDLAGRLGQNGREHVLKNFLLTRHIKDYLRIFFLLVTAKDSSDEK